VSALTDVLADLPPWAWAAGVAALVLLAARGARRRPRRGEVWFARVPFEDGSGSKDRPVLVLERAGRRYVVARFTSQNQSARSDYVAAPAGTPGLPKASWLSLRPTTLRRSAFRRRTGRPGSAFVRWYDDAARRPVR